MKLPTKPLHLFAVLTGLVIAIYSYTFQCGFIHFDDNTHIFENPVVVHGLTWVGIHAAFTQFIAAQWIPLSWLSHMLDVSLFGLNDPGWPHLENVAFHALNACLVWVAFNRLTRNANASFVVALLFAVHPINVESVAWVAERKNLLSTTFWLLAMDTYGRYCQDPKRQSGMWLVALWMALGLLAKQMLVTLPCALLVLDFWPLRRTEEKSWIQLLSSCLRLVGEKWMLFVLAAASSFWTIHGASASGFLVDGGSIPIYWRIINAVVGYAGYLINLVWPVSLGILYPVRQYPTLQIAGAFLLVIAISTGCLCFRKRAPYLIAGWLWFLGTLLPVSGLFQIGPQMYADRFVYVPELGLFWAAVWAISEIKSIPRERFAIIAGGVTLLLAGLTCRQVSFWTDTTTIFEHTLAVAADTGKTSMLAARGRELQGDYSKAIAHLRNGERVRPNSAVIHYQLGRVLLHEQQMEEGIEELKTTLKLDPNDSDARLLLVKALAATGRGDEARKWMPLTPQGGK